MGATSVLLAVLSAGALQTTDIPWAAEFLTDYGWLGLFIMSSALNAWLFRQVNKVRDEWVTSLDALREVHRDEIREHRERYERELNRAEAQIRQTTDTLLEEYRIRIAMLSQQHPPN